MKNELRALASLAGPYPPFDAEAAPDDPRDLFSSWLREAIVSGIREPHAMVLSTTDENGAPDARVLILKNLDARGWHFATSGNGPKGSQIAANPYVALTFYWAALGRQVRLRGIAFPAGEPERAADFRARSPAARAAALASRSARAPTSMRQSPHRPGASKPSPVSSRRTGSSSSSCRMRWSSGRAPKTGCITGSYTGGKSPAGCAKASGPEPDRRLGARMQEYRRISASASCNPARHTSYRGFT